MQIGLFCEMETDPEVYTEYDIWHNTLKQIEAADKLGFDAVWVVEHHFTPGYSHSACQEVLFGAASQRTERIRLGTAVRLLPMHDPIRTAERIAAVDILSNGRVEFGIGRGVAEREFKIWNTPAPYGATNEASRKRFLEYIDVIKKCWTEESFTYDGDLIKIHEPVSVVPKPVQKPHPRIWSPASSPASTEAYLKMGIHMMTATILGGFPEATAATTAMGRKIWEEAGHAEREPLQVGCLVPVHCARTRELAKEEMRPYEERYMQLLAKFFAPPTPEEAAVRKAAMPEGTVPYWEKPPTFDEAYAGRMMIIGDPDDCIREVKEYEKAGVTMIQGAFQLGGMPHDMVMESIKLFGDEVIPNLA